jgi:hypothetical protein
MMVSERSVVHPVDVDGDRLTVNRPGFSGRIAKIKHRRAVRVLYERSIASTAVRQGTGHQEVSRHHQAP